MKRRQQEMAKSFKPEFVFVQRDAGRLKKLQRSLKPGEDTLLELCQSCHETEECFLPLLFSCLSSLTAINKVPPLVSGNIREPGYITRSASSRPKLAPVVVTHCVTDA